MRSFGRSSEEAEKATLVPKFLREFRVNKEDRVIEAEFYEVPDFTPVLRKLVKSTTCIKLDEKIRGNSIRV